MSIANVYKKGVVLMTPISASTNNPISGVISSSLGFTAFSLTGTYFLACSATVEGREHRCLLSDLASKLSGLTASYNLQLNSVRLSRATPIAIIVPTGSLAARVLGMSGNISGSLHAVVGAEFSSSVAPYNLWKSSYAERSKWTRPYEPASFYFDHEADDGTTYSIGRTSTSKFSDWSFEFEPKRKVWKDAETEAEPFSLQRFLETVRTIKPFVVLSSNATASVDFSGTKEGIYKLRAEGSFFKPRFKDANYHNHVHFDFKTRVLSGGVG